MKTKQDKQGLKGFAAFEEEKRLEAAARGGRVAHSRGNTHEFTPEEARSAGAIGGLKTAEDRAHMARIGSLGGRRAAEARKARRAAESSPGATMSAGAA
jgi:uncharacterized protein